MLCGQWLRAPWSRRKRQRVRFDHHGDASEQHGFSSASYVTKSHEIFIAANWYWSQDWSHLVFRGDKWLDSFA